MAGASRDELSKTDFLKLADSGTGKLTKVIAPNPLQVGLDDDQFRSSFTVKGPVFAEQGITGSLWYVSDGVDYLQAGTNITVTKNANGSLTIATTGLASTEALSLDNGLEYDSGTTYDGSTARILSPKFVPGGGLQAVSNAGMRINFDYLNSDTIETEDWIIFGELDNATANFPKRCTVADLLSLGTGATISNAITFGNGIKDSASSAASWNNSAPATISIDPATNGGLSFDGSKLYVNPSDATVTTTVDLVNDYVLMYDASAAATRKVALQYVAGQALSSLTVGNGLSPNGSAYDGGSGVTLAVLNSDPTINVAAGGISVHSVPNSLTAGDGIETFSFNGATATTVALDRSTSGGLNFNGSGELLLDINNLSAGATPAATDEMVVSFGSGDSKKVDIGTIGDVITTGIVSSTVWVDGGLKAKTTSSISIDSNNRYADGTGMADAFFFVSGSIGSRGTETQGTSVFGGDVHSSGSITANKLASSAISGSLTRLQDGTSYLIAGSNVTITSASNGSITIASSGGGSGAAIDVVSGSTTVTSVDNINVTKLGILQSLGSGDIAITGSIGDAEDGSYEDGLFTDFTTVTPVGIAVDRFNEVLKGLAPGAAPNLDDMNCADSGVAAILSFGSSQSITDYSNVQPSSLTPTNNLSNVDINGTYSSTTTGNDVRVACFSGATVINGILNADVTADGVNYEQYSFGDGNQGTLKLYANDNTTAIHSVDLSTFGSGDHLNGDSSGFVSLSTSTSGHFADGSNFSTFQHRTGSYQVGVVSQRDGWNWARVVHTVGGVDRTCNYAEWVNDPSGSVNDIAAAGSVLDTLSMTGQNKLSGVKYNTGGTAEYRVRVSNAYRNVYSTSNITFGGSNCSVSSQSFPAIDYASGENETKVLHITGSATINADPILDGSISVDVNVPHPLKPNLSSAGSQSISGILLYNLSDTSTTIKETFRNEAYRLISGSYNAQSDVTTPGNSWDSGKHVSGSNTGYADGLIYYNSRLYYPTQTIMSGDFRNTADGGSITNGPSSNVNYSSLAGTRVFYRYFKNTSGGSKSNFSIAINGSGTIVSQSTSLSAANVHVLLKLPTTTSTFSTGWMDLAVAFATGQTGDGAGCLDGSLDSSLNATNGVTFGTQSVGSNEYIMVKVEADASWTGNISQMSISWT